VTQFELSDPLECADKSAHSKEELKHPCRGTDLLLLVSIDGV